jgi:hypothetical protein
MATATRIYHVNVEGLQYLVRASHPSAALMHVARNISAVRVASQDDLINCLSDGIKVENAKEEAAPAPAPAKEPSLPLWPTPAQAEPAEDEENGDEDDDEADAVPAASRPPKRMAAKYRCEMTGSTWSGRGLMPIWLKVALKDPGRKLDDYLVKDSAQV